MYQEPFYFALLLLNISRSMFKATITAIISKNKVIAINIRSSVAALYNRTTDVFKTLPPKDADFIIFCILLDFPH